MLAVCTAAALVAGFAILRSEFEAKYPRGIAIFPWVLGAAIVRGVSQPFSSYLYSRGRGRRVLGSRVTGLAVNAALCLLWIPTTGALGAARATLASYVTEAVLLTALARARSRPVDPPASVP